MGLLQPAPSVASSDNQRLVIPGRNTKPTDGHALVWDGAKGNPAWAPVGGGGAELAATTVTPVPGSWIKGEAPNLTKYRAGAFTFEDEVPGVPGPAMTTNDGVPDEFGPVVGGWYEWVIQFDLGFKLEATVPTVVRLVIGPNTRMTTGYSEWEWPVNTQTMSPAGVPNVKQTVSYKFWARDHYPGNDLFPGELAFRWNATGTDPVSSTTAPGPFIKSYIVKLG